MAGYLQGATKSERPLQDLIGTVPGMFADGPKLTFNTFASQISLVAQGSERKLMDPAYFSCRGRVDCDNKETRLDLVMSNIERRRDDLAIVITDMWFADPLSTTSGLVPLAAPVEKILADGRTIGVFGIPAPFDGTIYDLPGGGSEPFVGKRPLIMLVIGAKDRVVRFGDQLAKSPSAYIAQKMQSGGIQQALFTIDPSRSEPKAKDPLSTGNDPRVRPAMVLEAIEGVRIQQFKLDRGSALRTPKTQPELPNWQGPAPSAFLGKAIWRGPFAARSLVWHRQGERCGPGDWSEPTKFAGGWQAGEAEGIQSYHLDPSEFVAEFRRPGVYLVTGEVARTSLTRPNPAATWLREWSFSSQQPTGRTQAQGAAFYRTLNLAEFGRLMENALADAAEHKPGPITGFTFVVEVSD